LSIVSNIIVVIIIVRRLGSVLSSLIAVWWRRGRWVYAITSVRPLTLALSKPIGRRRWRWAVASISTSAWALAALEVSHYRLYRSSIDGDVDSRTRRAGLSSQVSVISNSMLRESLQYLAERY
jgi:hypothetical protein